MISLNLFQFLVGTIIACGPWIVNLYSRVAKFESRAEDQANQLKDLKDELKEVRTEGDARYEMLRKISESVAVLTNEIPRISAALQKLTDNKS